MLKKWSARLVPDARDIVRASSSLWSRNGQRVEFHVIGKWSAHQVPDT